MPPSRKAAPVKKAARQPRPGPPPDAPAPAPAPAPAAEQPADPSGEMLNLDTLEREDAKAPFRFIHGGRSWTMTDPNEWDWQVLLANLGNPVLLMRLGLPEADRDEFFKLPMPTWKMKVLGRRYEQHFGLPSLPEDDALPD